MKQATYHEYVKAEDGSVIARLYSRQGGLIDERQFNDMAAAQQWIAQRIADEQTTQPE